MTDKPPPKPSGLPPLRPSPPPPLQSPAERLKALRDRLQNIESGVAKNRLEAQLKGLQERKTIIDGDYEKALSAYNQALDQFHNITAPLGGLTFRSALQANPNLAAFVRGDPLWLRLCAILYGGYADFGTAETLIEYQEIAEFLGMESFARDQYVNNPLYAEKWGSKRWSNEAGDDPTMVMAKYLDNGQDGKKELTKIPAMFTPAQIYRDAAKEITADILATLEGRAKPETLKAQFEDYWRSGGRPELRGDALAALLALGVDITAQLRRALGDPKEELAGRAALRRIKAAALGIRDAVTRSHLTGQISLERLADAFFAEDNDPQRETDLIEAALRTLLRAGRVPLSIPATSYARHPYYLAEAWAYWLSGYGDDAKYNFAVVLDTLGKKIDPVAPFAIAHRAQNLAYEKHPGWRLEAIPPRHTDVIEACGDLLTIMEGSAYGRLEDLGSSGILDTAIKPRLKSHPELLIDAQAAALSFNAEWAAQCLKVINPKLSDYAEGEIPRVIMREALGETNPAIRARALWRLGNNLRRPMLWDESLRSADAIPDALPRERAYERLLQVAPRRERGGLLASALSAARQIDDPENQVRALGRLAGYEEESQAVAALYSEALTILETVANARQKVETALLIRPFLMPFPELAQRLAALLNGVEDVWLRQKASGLIGLRALAVHPTLKNAADWSPFILLMALDAVSDHFQEADDLNGRWEGLLDPSTRKNALRALLDAGLRDGLALSTTGAAALDALLMRDDTLALEDVAVLLPLLKLPDPAALPILESWLPFANAEGKGALHRRYADHAALYLAELTGVSEPTAAGVLRLVASAEDRTRYRASILLHGIWVDGKKVSRDYRTSSLGINALWAIYYMGARWIGKNPAAAQVVGWFNSNVIHDDGEILREIARRAEGEDGVKREIALRILSGMEYITPEAARAMVDVYQTAQTMLLKRALLIAASRTLHNKDKLPQLPDEFFAAVDADGEAVWTAATTEVEQSGQTGWYMLEGRTAAVMDALEQVLKAEDGETPPPPEVRAKAAEAALRTHMTPIYDAKPESLGRSMYYFIGGTDSSYRQSLNAVQPFSASEKHLKGLMDWLYTRLRARKIQDKVRYFTLTAQLLEALRAFMEIATTMPAIFADYADKLSEKSGGETFDTLIREAIIEHDSFWGRVSAVYLLGYLRSVDVRIIEAIQAALSDVDFVQEAMRETAPHIRKIKGDLLDDVLPPLFALLEGESALTAYITANLLAAIGRSERTKPDERTAILAALARAVKNPRSRRGVYILAGGGGKEDPYRPDYLTRLDQALHGALVQIAGGI